MRQKLIDLIARGSDIEFSYRGVRYTILPWTEDGIVVGKQGSDDDAAFPDSDALFSGFLLDGKPLSDIADEIELGFSS